MDRFRCEAEKRFSEICMLNEVFGFLNPHALLRSENIKDIKKFKNIYADDLNFSELTCKIAGFKRLVQFSGTSFQSDATALDVLQWLTKYCLCESTPYLFLCLKLSLTVAVSIASCERSSKLKLIKCYLRSTMGESRLSALAIPSIESDFVEMLSFEDIISEFVSVKAQRIQFELLIRIKPSLLFLYCVELH